MGPVMYNHCCKVIRHSRPAQKSINYNFVAKHFSNMQMRLLSCCWFIFLFLCFSLSIISQLINCSPSSLYLGIIISVLQVSDGLPLPILINSPPHQYTLRMTTHCRGLPARFSILPSPYSPLSISSQEDVYLTNSYYARVIITYSSNITPAQHSNKTKLLVR